MFNSLNSILSGFTKTQKQLETFLEKNAAVIKKDRLALDIKELEQEKATAVKGRIEEFLNAPAADAQ